MSADGSTMHAMPRMAVRGTADTWMAFGPLPKRVDVPTWANTFVREPSAIADELRTLAAAHPGMARVEVAGRSRDGREILALIIGSRAIDPNVPRVLITAGVHGRETANAPLLVDWARDLLARADRHGAPPAGAPLADAAHGGAPVAGAPLADAARGALLAHRTVVLVPQVNPDTAQDVVDGLRTGDVPRIWARTNRAHVDLNRNFPGPTWGAGSADPTSQNYRGSSPASEPETRAVLDIARTWTPAAVYDVHSPGGVILLPTRAAASLPGAAAPADATAAAALANRASGYDVATSADTWKHETGGTIKDWAHDVLGVPALTIETGAVHHQTPQLAADTRARLFPTLDALVATVDGRHAAPFGAELLAQPKPAERFVMSEHVHGVEVRWPAEPR